MVAAADIAAAEEGQHGMKQLTIRLLVAEAKQANSLLGIEEPLTRVPLPDGSLPACEYPENIAALAIADPQFPHQLHPAVKVGAVPADPAHMRLPLSAVFQALCVRLLYPLMRI
jgi:hypothetical protein